ncbi:Sec-independent protein translocase subunit TatA [Streptomyces sp. NPDC050610]|uniref:Sec-independent protein translocase subunit TatA n=1 Tax=Streptomyces sp. NPDC050610 TaxID=3157097 RepID=UPI00342EF82E
MLRNGLEPWHLIVLVVVALLVFGSKKLPDIARGLGKSARILKSEARAMRSEDSPKTSPAEPAAAPTVTPGPPAADTAQGHPDTDRVRTAAEQQPHRQSA